MLVRGSDPSGSRVSVSAFLGECIKGQGQVVFFPDELKVRLCIKLW